MSKTTKTNSVIIDGIEYIPKSEQNQQANLVDKLPLVMIRTYSAGVHFGYLKSKISTLAGMEVILLNARRVYQWAGAMTLSQLSMEGSTLPAQCKFTIPVNKIELIAIEIIEITEKASLNFNTIPLWKM